MPKREKGFPRWLRLRKIEERHITALLAGIPVVRPEITVQPFVGEAFALDYQEVPDYFVPLIVGAESFFADYDAADGSFLEANHLRVAREVRACGKRAFDVYEAGGSYCDGPFKIIWYGPHYCRFARGGIEAIDRGCSEERSSFPCHFELEHGICWDGPDTATGPETGVAGFNQVRIADRTHECMRVFQFHEFADDPGNPQLDDRYVGRDGRTVLLRRYRTREEYEEQVKQDDGKAEGFGEPSLTYNGVPFLHWFDILTDTALRPLLIPWEAGMAIRT